MSTAINTTVSKYGSIRRLTHADTKKAAPTLLASFRNDALAKLLVVHIKSQEERDQVELALYEAYLNQHMTKGYCFGIGETASGFETVAIWSHPESINMGLESFAHLMESGYDKVWAILNDVGREKVFYGMLPLLHDSCDRILNNDSRFKHKKLFTLVYLGSLPSAQGKGNVRKMFSYMFDKYVDVTENSICYLESSSPTNIPIYNRFDYHFYEDIMLGENFDGAQEGKDFAVMNVMIRGHKGADWRQEVNHVDGKL